MLGLESLIISFTVVLLSFIVVLRETEIGPSQVFLAIRGAIGSPGCNPMFVCMASASVQPLRSLCSCWSN